MHISELIQGMEHIGIPSKDVDKTVAFYKGLGFTVAYERSDERFTVAFLKLQDIMIETYQVDAAVECPGAVDHIAIAVSDVEKAFELIQAGDYEMIDKEIQGVPFWSKGSRFFKFYGPNREILEFSQIL